MGTDPGHLGSSEALKACCAAAYEHELTALLLGESYHPGGLALTRHLARHLGIGSDDRVLDVASGNGATAILLSEELGASVDGVDLGRAMTAAARANVESRGLSDKVRLAVGNAELLPYPDASFEAVICECALCTFPDKAQAVAEFARVLRPGGVLGITDIVLDPARLEPELRSLGGWIACLAGAVPLEELLSLVEGAGFRIALVEAHDEALRSMIERIEARLALADALLLEAAADIDIGRARELAASAARAVDGGIAGYALVVARTS